MKEGVLCIGAAHVDRKMQTETEVRWQTSIPVRSEGSLGGVARNVAENLARLDCPVALLSRVGEDAEGRWVTRQAVELGIDLAGVSLSLDRSTASYTAVLDPRGELVIGLADMEIYDELTPEHLDRVPESVFDHRIWFLDTNLSASALEWLAERARPGQVLVADPVSVPKAERLRGLLGRLDVLLPSRDEAEVLSGISVQTRADAERAAEVLCKQGVRQVILTLGEDGVVAAGEGINGHFPALRAKQVRDVTGAGDALIAGYLQAMLQGLAAAEAIQCGIVAATLTLESAATVWPELTPSRLRARMENND
jgi:pseudouridine kinase